MQALVLVAELVFLTERSWVIALLWAAPVFVLGNIWAALWFVVRLPHLAKQLSKPDWPASMRTALTVNGRITRNHAIRR